MLATAATDRFAALSSFLAASYSDLDLDALRIALAVAISHSSNSDPVWLFVIGPPASGKTSVVIRALEAARGARIIGNLTQNTLLSGRPSNGSSPTSLLKQVGSGILLMKDFTTVISKRAEERAEIAAQLREVYDGRYVKSTGMGTTEDWEGKITLVAACTPAIEREWMLLRDLGERFVSVRWGRGDGTAAGLAALRQRGREGESAARIRELAAGLLIQPDRCPGLDEPQARRLAALAEIVALARNRVVRDSHGSREIIDVPPAETPARIVKALAAVATNHAAIFGREVGGEDMRLAARVAMDSIPARRSQLLQAVPVNAEISRAAVAELTGMSSSTLDWQAEELAALGLLRVSATDSQFPFYSYSPVLRELWEDGWRSV